MLDIAPLADVPSVDVTFTQWVGQRARLHGARPALTYVHDDGVTKDEWSYAELWQRSFAVAMALRAVGKESEATQRRALLLFPPGLEFMAGFLGCQIAGWIPVPTCYPKPGRAMPRLDSATEDCSPSAIVCDRATSRTIDETRFTAAARGLARIETETSLEQFAAELSSELIDSRSLSQSPDDLAFLQYTSGSTSEAKGVMVRHRNLMANLHAIQLGFGLECHGVECEEFLHAAFWLPFYHDMGLIGGLLATLYLGGHSLVHSPRSFLQRPIRWLQLISDHGIAVSGAPNFAYQLCVDRIPPEQTDSLDLHSWRTAFCGAEPILARTLSDFGNRFAACGFSDSAFYPCYGLAESSLLVAGGDGPSLPKVIDLDRVALGSSKIKLIQPRARRVMPASAVQSLVSCGRAVEGMEIEVVDPQTCRIVSERSIGEIWIRGTSVAAGYWKRDADANNPFGAEIARGVFSRAKSDANNESYFRTGDLGFFHDGELYVTGRLKDIIIMRGRNHYPQDIEATVRKVIGESTGQSTGQSAGQSAGQCAAFSAPAPRGESLAIVAEMPRHAGTDDLADLVRSIRRHVIDIHEIDPRHVLLVRPATVPMTTSGKIQRSKCRQMFDAGEIQARYRYDRSSASEQTPIAIAALPHPASVVDRPVVDSTLRAWLSEWLISRAGVEPHLIEDDKPFSDYGLDSMTAVELSGELEDWTGIELTPIVAWNHPTIEKMAEFITDQFCGGSLAGSQDSVDPSTAVDHVAASLGG